MSITWQLKYMMLETRMFCIVCSVRYSNSKLMHVGHQHMADILDPKKLNGLLEFKTFHLTPDGD